MGFWWSHIFPVDLCFLINETKMGTKMIPNTRWARRVPGSLPGLQGAGEPIHIQPIPTCPKAQAFLVGLRMMNKAHSLVRNICSFVWKKRQAVSRCSIYIFSSDNWTLRMISACYEMCQNYNKISNLYHPPTYLIIFPESASLLSITGWKRQRKESSKGVHTRRDTDTTIRSETCFSPFNSPICRHNGMVGSVESIIKKGPWFKPCFCSLLAIRHAFQASVSLFVKWALMTRTS